VVNDIEAGEVITAQHIKSIRPGFGLHPKYYSNLIGKQIKNSKKFGDRLCMEDI
jgi:pseudaminic acid synthase